MRLPMQQDEEIAKLLVGTMFADGKKRKIRKMVLLDWLVASAIV